MNPQPTLRSFFVIGLFLLACPPGFSQSTSGALLSLDRIFKKPYLAGTRPSDPTISPDGKVVFFRWDSSAQNKYRYWMMASDGSAMHELADTLLGEIAWSPDSKTIACTRKGDIFLTDTSFRTFNRLTKTDASENSLHWSRDGKLLAFESDNRLVAVPIGTTGLFEIARSSLKDGSANLVEVFPDGKRVLFTESSNDSLPEFVVPRFTGKDVSTRSFKGGIGKSNVGIAPIDTGKTIWVKLPGNEHFFLGDMSLSPDGKKLLIERFSANRKKRELFLADTDSGKARLIFTEEDNAWVEGGLYTSKWTPDSGEIITTSEKEGWNHLYSMTPDGKNLTRLTRGDWEIRWFDIAPSGKKIFFLANKEEHSQWQLYSYDMKSKNISRLTSRIGTYDNPRLAKDGSFIIAEYSNFAQPTDLVRVPTPVPAPVESSDSTSPDNGGEVQLTHSVPDAFKRMNWVIPEIVHFRSRDGKSIPAVIYKPNDFSPATKYPVVVFAHGAGYLQNVFRGWSYYYREYLFHHRLTQKGYIVFEVEYRGSAGLGRDFRTDVYMHLGGKDLQDELDGLEYLRGLGYIDPHRVGIYGGSYGGFMALMGLFTTDSYACAAALRAVTSWENYYKHNPWYTQARLGKPEENAEAYKISSPITYADSMKRPLLILHGMVDDNVFFQDAVQLIAKLQKGGKRFEVMVYPDEAHSFTEPESWYDEYSRIEEFFDKNLMVR